MELLKKIAAIALLLAFISGFVAVIAFNITEFLYGVFLLIFIYLIFVCSIGYSVSERETFWGRLKDGFSFSLNEIAKFFAKASYEIGTPKSEKELLYAEKLHAAMLITMNTVPSRFTPEIYYDEYKAHQQQLKILGIDRDKWLTEAYPIWYKGFLRVAYNLPHEIEEQGRFDKKEKLKETLLYFGITTEEWTNRDAKIMNIIDS